MRPSVQHLLRTLFFILAFPLLGLAQSNIPVTITADSLAFSDRGGQRVQQMFGNVRFVQGNLFGKSEYAILFIDENRVELSGEVEIQQDTLLLRAPNVTYDGNTRMSHATGGVFLSDRDATLHAETGDYDLDRQVAYFHRNVRLMQNRNVITSNDLTYYRATQTTIAKGKVRVVSDSGRLEAAEVIYSRPLDETTASGNVELKSDSVNLSSDWFYNSTPRGEMFARGHVRVRNPLETVWIFGDTLARLASTALTVVPRNPLLVMVDTSTVQDTVTGKLSTRLDTTFIRSARMEIYQSDTTRFIAIDSVSLLRTSFAARGGYLDFNRTTGVMTLARAQRQRVWYDSTEIDADSITLFMVNDNVDRVYADRRAFMTSPVAELPGGDRVQQLQGEHMFMRVIENEPSYLLVTDNALSMYFLVRDGNQPDGLNRASGDSIRITFKDRQTDRITIISGTEGEYWPERFVKGRASAFRLSAYERHPGLRPQREEYDVVQYLGSSSNVTSPLPAQ